MDEKLENYFRRLLEEQSISEKDYLGENELKELSLKLGFSKQEYENLQKVALDHFQTGLSFLEYENFEDALAEFEKTLVIRPFDTVALIKVAETYYRRWQLSGLTEHKANAEKYARRALQFQPNQPEAVRLISQLKGKQSKILPKIFTQSNKSGKSLTSKEVQTHKIAQSGKSKNTEELFWKLYPVLLMSIIIFFALILPLYYKYGRQKSVQKFTKTENKTTAMGEIKDTCTKVVLVEDDNCKGLSLLKVKYSAASGYYQGNTQVWARTQNFLRIDGIEVNQIGIKVEVTDKKGRDLKPRKIVFTSGENIEGN